MTKKSVILLFLFLSISELWASSVMQYPLQQAEKASFEKKIVEWIKKPVIRGQFKQTKSIPKLNRNFISNGTFLIASDKGLILNVQKPFISTMIITREMIIQKNASGKKETLKAKDTPSFIHFSEMMISLFSKKPENLYTHFSVFFNMNNQSWDLGLVPKDPSVRSVIFSIELSGENDFPHKMILNNADGSKTQYDFFDAAFFSSLNSEETGLFDGR